MIAELGREVLDQLHHGGASGGQIPIEEQILARDTCFHVQDQVISVVADCGTEEPIRMIGTLVDQLVGRLRLSESVQVELRVLCSMRSGRLYHSAAGSADSRKRGHPWSIRRW